MASIDQNHFKWKEDHTVPGRFTREPIGGEKMVDLWNILNHGDGNMFLGLYIKLSNPLQGSEFITYLREAWKSLRWEVPTIAMQVFHVPTESRFPQPYLVYDVAKSSSEVDVWAKATATLMGGYENLDDLRYHIGQSPLPPTDFAPQTLVYALQTSAESFGILIHTSHVSFDGAGVKIIGKKLLSHLSHYIGDPNYQKLESKKMRWGSESENLVPVMLDIIQSYEPAVKDSNGNIIKKEILGEIREGPAYDKTLAEVLEDGIHGSTHSHPLKSIIRPMFDVKKQKPRTRRLHYTFTLEESAKIQAACAPSKSMPEKLTVNHILHGAVGLLTMLDNPPKKGSDAVVFFWGIINARKRLIPHYRNYPGYCLGVSAIKLPVSLYERFSSEDRRMLVLEFAKAIRQEYKKQAEYPSLASVAGEEIDIILQAPPPPPSCDPWYVGDGRGSLYLSPSYNVDGQQVLELSDFFVGINRADPGPCFRTTEWNGHIILNIDYNELAVETKTVEHWLNLWRDLALSV
ncbi:hypothetical protein Clacol_002278 [Clathrus columnatus]|uniref:Uncharacterized protein n=1 Tax=Clathrus columnatus TaxID=1419009 RepID=A0AAV5A0A4_9AGAM|nr:hypothetical protein Clacol_002278 [Clathrus columnatus]